jgi:hypothetical protein
MDEPVLRAPLVIRTPGLTLAQREIRSEIVFLCSISPIDTKRNSRRRTSSFSCVLFSL